MVEHLISLDYNDDVAFPPSPIPTSSPKHMILGQEGDILQDIRDKAWEKVSTVFKSP